MARKTRSRSTIYVLSVGAHLLLGLGIALIPKEKLREVVGIAMSETKKPAPKAEPAKREEKPRAPQPRSGPARRLAAAPAAAAVEAAATPTFTDIGIALDANAVGGIPLQIAPKVVEKPAPAAVEPSRPKVLAARINNEQCAEPLLKAHPERPVQPEYTPAARAARVEGRVRLELSIDDRGNVKDVRVLKSLGYGLDEAAIAAAKKMHFRPALQCARPVVSQFTLSMRFVYGA